MIKPLLTVLASLILLLVGTFVAPSVVTNVMVISFSFGLLKAFTVIAAARFALAYLDSRIDFDVNGWVKFKANNDNKAMYFSYRFAAVFVVFGFIMA